MKKLIAVLIVGIVLASSTRYAYAGEAWPWVVGGLAGLAILSSAAHHHDGTDHVYERHVYHTPVHVSYSDNYQRHGRYNKAQYRKHHDHRHHRYAKVRIWNPGYYDHCGIYQPGYYSYEYVR